MSSESSFDVRPMTREDVPAYLAFARAAYGPHAYQSQARYLRWLYETPGSLGRGYEDAKLAVDGGVVVGCIHKMRYRIRTGDELAELACPHNLFVNASHRHGAGLALIMESFKDEKHIFLMGVMPPVTAIYEKLRCKPIPAYWHRAILNPVTALVAYPLSRFARRYAEAVVERIVDLACVLGRLGACHVSRADDSADARRALAALRRGDTVGTATTWDDEAITHRFLHHDAPQHLIFELAGASPRGVAVVSVGLRRGLVAARIVESAASSGDSMATVIRAVRRCMRAAGANVLLGYTTSEDMHRAFGAAGLSVQPEAPCSYVLSRRGGSMRTPIELGGGSGDFGFEAIKLEPSS